MVMRVVEVKGHLIDSNILSRVMDVILEGGGKFEFQKFEVGRTNKDESVSLIKIIAPTSEKLGVILKNLSALGCYSPTPRPAVLREAEADGTVPEDFYATTNQRTEIFYGGRWIEVEDQRMDSVIVVEDNRARCRLLRDVRAGDMVVCGIEGIRVMPEFKPRDRYGFAFMDNGISSERRVEIAVRRLALMMREQKRKNGKIVMVAGPVIVHTGGARSLAEIIRRGYVNAILAGNALAVHDIELALYGTSLGVDLHTGIPMAGGHRNHVRAINVIRSCGGIRKAVEQGILQSGIMYECIKNDVPFVLAGSIRDDGPLPETVMDLIKAQSEYNRLLKGATLVLMLASMLHSIGTGNMLPAWVPTICVDINPAVVTKLADRGSSQTIGIVTDVGLFLHLLNRELGEDKTD